MEMSSCGMLARMRRDDPGMPRPSVSEMGVTELLKDKSNTLFWLYPKTKRIEAARPDNANLPYVLVTHTCFFCRMTGKRKRGQGRTECEATHIVEEILHRK